MLGMLSIAINSSNCTSWATIGNWLGVAQQVVADKVQKINLANEIEVMKENGVHQINDNEKMKWPLTCTYDMGWQKHASGKNNNSPSGHSFLVASYTNKVICHICYSKGCRYCMNLWKKQGLLRAEATKGEPTGELHNNFTMHCCPHNYNGLAKSMEACGAISMVTVHVQLWRWHYWHPCWWWWFHNLFKLQTFNLSSHGFEWLDKQSRSLAQDQRWQLCCWQWQVTHPCAGNPSHCSKSFRHALYKIEKSKGKELKFTAVDCERLKNNFNFWQWQNKDMTYEVFAQILTITLAIIPVASPKKKVDGVNSRTINISLKKPGRIIITMTKPRVCSHTTLL